VAEVRLIMRSSNYLRQAKRRQNRPDNNNHWAYTPNDEVIGKDSLASIMDVTITTVERWIRAQMPVEQRGDPLHDWVFNLSNVKSWRASLEE